MEKISEIRDILFKNLQSDNLGLMGGLIGKGLFFANYYEHSSDENDLLAVKEIIEHTSGKVNELFRKGFAVSNGIAGLAWFLQYCIDKNLFEGRYTAFLESLDQVMFPIALNQLKAGHYDHLHGALGVAMYSLRNPHQKSQKEFLEQSVLLLEKQAIFTEGACKWNAFDLASFKVKPDEFNMGLAHGMPGILMFLLKAYEKNILPGKTKELIRGGIAYILSSKQDPQKWGCYFPNSVIDGQEPGQFSRLAWCYGDLGVTVPLWKFAEMVADNQLKIEVIEILTYNSYRRDLPANYVWDAGFCHGTAGLAYLFHKFYSLTGNPLFEETASFWYEQTLKLATWPDGLAGYKSFHYNETPKWRNDDSMIEGITGIGLSLLDRDSSTSLSWDEIFLLN